MSTFGQSVREMLGVSKDTWVNVHALTPDQLSLDMFANTTLIDRTNGGPLSYYGYDASGKCKFSK